MYNSLFKNYNMKYTSHISASQFQTGGEGSRRHQNRGLIGGYYQLGGEIEFEDLPKFLSLMNSADGEGVDEIVSGLAGEMKKKGSPNLGNFTIKTWLLSIYHCLNEMGNMVKAFQSQGEKKMASIMQAPQKKDGINSYIEVNGKNTPLMEHLMDLAKVTGMDVDVEDGQRYVSIDTDDLLAGKMKKEQIYAAMPMLIMESIMGSTETGKQTAKALDGLINWNNQANSLKIQTPAKGLEEINKYGPEIIKIFQDINKKPYKNDDFTRLQILFFLPSFMYMLIRACVEKGSKREGLISFFGNMLGQNGGQVGGYNMYSSLYDSYKSKYLSQRGGNISDPDDIKAIIKKLRSVPSNKYMAVVGGIKVLDHLHKDYPALKQINDIYMVEKSFELAFGEVELLFSNLSREGQVGGAPIGPSSLVFQNGKPSTVYKHFLEVGKMMKYTIENGTYLSKSGEALDNNDTFFKEGHANNIYITAIAIMITSGFGPDAAGMFDPMLGWDGKPDSIKITPGSIKSKVLKTLNDGAGAAVIKALQDMNAGKKPHENDKFAVCLLLPIAFYFMIAALNDKKFKKVASRGEGDMYDIAQMKADIQAIKLRLGM